MEIVHSNHTLPHCKIHFHSFYFLIFILNYIFYFRDDSVLQSHRENAQKRKEEAKIKQREEEMKLLEDQRILEEKRKKVQEKLLESQKLRVMSTTNTGYLI